MPALSDSSVCLGNLLFGNVLPSDFRKGIKEPWTPSLGSACTGLGRAHRKLGSRLEEYSSRAGAAQQSLGGAEGPILLGPAFLGGEIIGLSREHQDSNKA